MHSGFEGAMHFVLAYKPRDKDFVLVYNSMDADLGDHIKLQLSLLFGREARPVTIRFPSVHRQPAGSNLCGPLVCSFMAEIVTGKLPDKVAFCKPDEQRNWLHEVLSII